MSRDNGRRRAQRIALAAAVLTVAAGAAPAAAAYKIDKARFKVGLTGTQTTTWTTDRRDPFETCGMTYKGSGTQTMTFKTKRRAKVFALQAYDTTKNREHQGINIFGDRWMQSIRTAATIDRQGTLTTTPNSNEPCGDGDGSSPPPPPPAPDCGVRNFAAYLRFTHWPVGSYPFDPAPLTGVLTLAGPSPGVPRYANCPGAGDELILTPNASLRVKTVMGKVKRFSVRGEEREVYDNDGHHRTTTLTWKAKFTRVKTGKTPSPGEMGGVCQDGEDNDGDGDYDDRDADCYRTNGRSED